jgi:ornithine cyclodeaminase
MRFVSAEEVDRLLDYNSLADALAEGFRGGITAPPRHHHTIERASGTDSTMLLMPAWTDYSQADAANNGFMGVKVATVSPDNNALGKPAVMAVYLLADGVTGEPLALIDGQALTLWRTATASALAGRYLVRSGARRMAMLGAGKLAPHLVRAHAAMHDIAEVALWNRTPANAETLAGTLRSDGFSVTVAQECRQAVTDADIVSSATISSRPLVEGAWLKPGAHVDLVGAFTPQLRESDDEAVLRSSVFVDTYEGALAEAGDLVQPISAGLIGRSHVRADLAALCRGDHPGRTSEDEITLFKSCGASLEDFAAGCLVWKKLAR